MAPLSDLPGLGSSKRALRKLVLVARDSLSPEDIASRSASLRARLATLPQWKGATTVHLFAPFGSEVDTRPLLSILWSQGKATVLPRVAEGRRLEHCLATSEADLAPGAWSIPEPGRHCVEVSLEDIDLILVPGVAFDRHGGRLGYGGGFYDRFLSGCAAPRVALAFELQLVEAVPREAHDLLVHAIVTENELIIADGERVQSPQG